LGSVNLADGFPVRWNFTLPPLLGDHNTMLKVRIRVYAYRYRRYSTIAFTAQGDHTHTNPNIPVTAGLAALTADLGHDNVTGALETTAAASVGIVQPSTDPAGGHDHGFSHTGKPIEDALPLGLEVHIDGVLRYGPVDATTDGELLVDEDATTYLLKPGDHRIDFLLTTTGAVGALEAIIEVEW